MGARGVISFMAILVLLFPLAEAVVSERDHPQLPPDKQINLEETMDEDTAELLWANCEAELIHSMVAFQDLQHCGGDKTILGKERILKTMNAGDPHVKKTIQDCLRDKSIVVSDSIKDRQTRKWYVEYLESFLRRPKDVPGRRRLAEATVSNGTVVIAVVVTAIVTLCLAGVLFYCYIKTFGPAAIQNDEKPLLNLSLKGNSNSGVENSKDKDGKAQNQSKKDSSLDARVSVDPVASPSLMASGIPPLKPPPGKEASSLNPSSITAPDGRVTSTLRHTLKPRAARAESSLRPTHRKAESAIPTPAGRTESSLPPPAGRAESSLRPPAGRAESSLRPSPGGTDSSAQQPPANGASPAPPSPPPAVAASPSPPPPLQSTSPRPPSAGPPPPPPPSTGGAPPPPPSTGGAPPPPPPPIGGAPPPPPPRGGLAPPPPPKPGGGAPPPPPLRGGGGASAHRPPGGSMRATRGGNQADASKAKLKPFFWDKVMAKPDQAMVWHKIKSGSFQFNEEMIESLFGYQAAESNKNQSTKNNSKPEPTAQFIQIIDPKKAQNLSILLKALNVTTEEVSAALKEGNELPIELVQTLLKMAPTSEEELKLRLYGGDLSKLGPAERFIKSLVDIPDAYLRLESLLFMCTLQEEETNIKESLQTLEAACEELKKSRLFLKLLEAVLKTGNRMNVGTFRGSATAFKLDTLLKLSDVKGVDGKTTLLHFVVHEIILSEGIRAARAAKDSKSLSSIKTEDLVQGCSSEETEEYYRNLGLEVVSGLSSELENVKRAAIVDSNELTTSVSKLGLALVKARESLNNLNKDITNLQEESEDEETEEFWLILSSFVQDAEKEIKWMVEEEKRIMSLVKSTVDYFHGSSTKDEGLRIFTIVRDFLIILDKVCKEVKAAPLRPPKTKQKQDDQSPGTQKKDDAQPSSQNKDDQNQSTSGGPIPSS